MEPDYFVNYYQMKKKNSIFHWIKKNSFRFLLYLKLLAIDFKFCLWGPIGSRLRITGLEQAKHAYIEIGREIDT